MTVRGSPPNTTYPGNSPSTNHAIMTHRPIAQAPTRVSQSTIHAFRLPSRGDSSLQSVLRQTVAAARALPSTPIGRSKVRVGQSAPLKTSCYSIADEENRSYSGSACAALQGGRKSRKSPLSLSLPPTHGQGPSWQRLNPIQYGKQQRQQH